MTTFSGASGATTASRSGSPGESEFANARLPPGDPERDAVVAPDAPENVVKAAARELKKEHHPDTGGDEARFKQVVTAEEAMLDE